VSAKNDTEGAWLRDYFAGLAMQKLIGKPTKDWPMSEKGNDDSISGLSYELADAMLKARKKSDQ
jgi:hypothetical protein